MPSLAECSRVALAATLASAGLRTMIVRLKRQIFVWSLHNPAFLAILKTAQEWIDSYLRSNTTSRNLDDLSSFDQAHERIGST